MREIKLPFDLTPELNTYHHLAHPLGILGGNIPDKTIWFPWLCNKYINCSYTEKPKRSFELYSTDKFFVFDHIIDQIEIQILPDKYEKMLHVTEQSFIETVKALILAGSYIHGMNNERYISAMAPYQKYDFAHDYLLFGVSDESQCFYAAGYTADGKYQEYEIPYHEYYRSIFQPTYKGLSFRILQFNKEKKSYTTNFSVVVRDLKHYLNSTAFGAEKNDEKAGKICAEQACGIAYFRSLYGYSLIEGRIVDVIAPQAEQHEQTAENEEQSEEFAYQPVSVHNSPSSGAEKLTGVQKENAAGWAQCVRPTA